MRYAYLRNALLCGSLGLAASIGQHPLLRAFENPVDPNPGLLGGLVFEPWDMDLDGLPEFIAMNTIGRAFVVRNNGARLWVENPPGLPQTMLGGEPALADFDGDGLLDVFFPVYGGQDEVRFGNGTLLLAPPAANALPIVHDLTQVAIAADVDRDGRMDIVKLRQLSPSAVGSEVLCLMNRANGTFQEVVQGIATTDERILRVGDVDGDGYPDLLIPGYSGATRLFMNDRAGNFTPDTTGRLPVTPIWVTLGASFADIDGDGDMDLVVAGCGAPTVALYVNDGSGRFSDESAARMPPLLRWCVYDTLFVDIDADGDLDLLLANQFSTYAGRQNVAFENVGGSFLDATARWLTPRQRDSSHLAAVDIDADGDTDLVVANRPGTTNQMGRSDIHRNLTRHLWCSGDPRVGDQLRLELHGNPGEVATLFVGDSVQSSQVSPFGTVFLPLGGMTEVGTAPVGAGRVAHLSFVIPPDPAFAGRTLAFQALVGQPGTLIGRRTTNHWQGVILP